MGQMRMTLSRRVSAVEAAALPLRAAAYLRSLDPEGVVVYDCLLDAGAVVDPGPAVRQKVVRAAEAERLREWREDPEVLARVAATKRLTDEERAAVNAAHLRERFAAAWAAGVARPDGEQRLLRY